MSMRVPCDHGRYEKHPDGSNLGWWYCPGGRILTDAEALTILLFDVCEKCDGSGDISPFPDIEHDPCPACEGSGRTPKDGVLRVPGMSLGTGQPTESVFFPASMLDPEGDS